MKRYYITNRSSSSNSLDDFLVRAGASARSVRVLSFFPASAMDFLNSSIRGSSSPTPDLNSHGSKNKIVSAMGIFSFGWWLWFRITPTNKAFLQLKPLSIAITVLELFTVSILPFHSADLLWTSTQPMIYALCPLRLSAWYRSPRSPSYYTIWEKWDFNPDDRIGLMKLSALKILHFCIFYESVTYDFFNSITLG